MNTSNPRTTGATSPPNLRAIDISIGPEADCNQGYGREMMRLAHERCFADPAVTAIVIDPLARNLRAIAFYQRLGYVTVERRVFGDDDLCRAHADPRRVAGDGTAGGGRASRNRRAPGLRAATVRARQPAVATRSR